MFHISLTISSQTTPEDEHTQRFNFTIYGLMSDHISGFKILQTYITHGVLGFWGFGVLGTKLYIIL